MIDTEKKLKEEIEALEARISRLEEEFLRRRALLNQLELESLSRCACGCKDKEGDENIRGSQPEKLYRVRLYYQYAANIYNEDKKAAKSIVFEVDEKLWRSDVNNIHIADGPYGEFFEIVVEAANEDEALVEGYCKIEDWFEGLMVAHERVWDERKK